LHLVEIFPDLNEFELTGSSIVRGLQCDWYVKKGSESGEFEHFYYDPLLNMPVRWSMHSREEVFDSHIDDYVIDYMQLRQLNEGETKKLRETVKNDPCRADSNGQTGNFHSSYSSGKHLSHHRKHILKPKYPMGYIPLPERRHIEIFGDISIGDLLRTTDVTLPRTFDWRDRGGVPARVKDQAFCGSCYAFSVAASIESAYLLKNRNSSSINVSEQFLLDCGWSSGSSSCSGGNQQELGPLILQRFNGFIPMNSDYGQYMSTYSYCKNTTGMTGISIDAWVNLPARSSIQLIKKSLVNNGMLSVSINAVDEILSYREGIVATDACKATRSRDLNHAVNLVGYGTDEQTGTEYWILRNSWSDNWGEKGFFKVEMGDRDCGITIDVSFPIIKIGAQLVEKNDFSSILA
jgi:C1A family cysteine protease